MIPGRYPLAVSPRHWPKHIAEAWAEKSAIVQADYGCSITEADAIAERVIRAMYASGHLPTAKAAPP